jgi:hypothetical protein
LPACQSSEQCRGCYMCSTPWSSAWYCATINTIVRCRTNIHQYRFSLSRWRSGCARVAWTTQVLRRLSTASTHRRAYCAPATPFSLPLLAAYAYQNFFLNTELLTLSNPTVCIAFLGSCRLKFSPVGARQFLPMKQGQTGATCLV